MSIGCNRVQWVFGSLLLQSLAVYSRLRSLSVMVLLELPQEKGWSAYQQLERFRKWWSGSCFNSAISAPRRDQAIERWDSPVFHHGRFYQFCWHIFVKAQFADSKCCWSRFLHWEFSGSHIEECKSVGVSANSILWIRLDFYGLLGRGLETPRARSCIDFDSVANFSRRH